MARIYPLFSSSKGNASYVGSPESGILIDCGVSLRRLELAMTRCGLSMTAVHGVFITHDHSDHIQGLKMISKRFSIPLFAQERTMRNLAAGGHILPDTACNVIGEHPVEVAGITVSAFDTPHDTEQSCGYRIQMPDGRICAVCTDLGHVTDTVANALSGCDLVLLEANYDIGMLKSGSYPAQLKTRIASRNGHLSNIDSAAQARKLVENGTTHLILGHLSQENNRPELVERAVVDALSGYIRGQDYLLSVAKVETDGEMTVF